MTSLSHVGPQVQPEFAAVLLPSPEDAAELAAWHAAERPDDFDATPPPDARMGFVEWLETQAAFHRAQETEADDFAASLFEWAASTARGLHVTCPSDFWDRHDVEETFRDLRLKGGAL
jgi:hypothetical protein